MWKLTLIEYQWRREFKQAVVWDPEFASAYSEGASAQDGAQRNRAALVEPMGNSLARRWRGLKVKEHFPISVVALVLAFGVAGCQPATAPPPGTSTPQPVVASQTPRPTASQGRVFPLAGVWTGTAKNGTFVMQATITMDESCHAGGKCGTFNLITIPCSGTFSLVAEDHGIYEFRAGDQQGNCGIGKDFLQLLPDGALQYTSRGDYGETLGILRSQAAAAAPNPSAKKLPVIYEDDGSPDGTTALLYLLSNPAVEVTAAAISYGEAHPAIYAQFVGRKLDDFGFKAIPLGVGQDGPLSGHNGFPDWLRQSADTFWGLPAPTSTRQVPVEKAPELMVSVLNQAREPMTLFISGPATDLAQALRLDPTIKDKIAAVYMMGGAVYVPGNISDFYPQPNNLVAEWNVYADPEAAKEVFESGLSIYLVPLDATNQVTVDKQDTSQWRKGGEIANFAAIVYGSLLDSTGKQNMAIWDLMTSVIMIQPDLCGFKPLHLQVVTAAGPTNGQTIVVDDGKPNVSVCLQPDGDGIKREITTIFSTQH